MMVCNQVQERMPVHQSENKMKKYRIAIDIRVEELDQYGAHLNLNHAQVYTSEDNVEGVAKNLLASMQAWFNDECELELDIKELRRGKIE